ncbi:MAG: hypothetical protein QW279_11400 [Candidatus Jordarchaeaceae archaeon]
MKSIGVSDYVWQELVKLKKEKGLSSLSQTILYLVVKERAKNKEGENGRDL